jgi:hypothetical protein
MMMTMTKKKKKKKMLKKIGWKTMCRANKSSMNEK